MIQDLQAALRDEPWSFAGVIHGLGNLLDEDGRPLSERRAPAIVKEGVAMELRPCPYGDERRRRSMNVSALDQITNHLDAVLDDIARFRATLPSGTSGWEDVYTTMADQLTRAPIHLLRCRNPEGPIPVQMSVGYKIAAGFSVPLRELLELEATGLAQEVSTETLLDLVKRHEFLIGAGEVCAAPPSMIARVTKTLIQGVPGSEAEADPERVAFARTLTLQIRIGIAWGLFDLASEKALLVSEIGKKRLSPRTEHLARRLDERVAELDEVRNTSRGIRLPDGLAGGTAEKLHAAMRPDVVAKARSHTTRVVEGLLGHGDGAVELDAPARELFARNFSTYLDAYRTFARVIRELERQHRRGLGFPEDVPVKLNGTVFPIPKALPWFERIIGHRLRFTGSSPETMVLRNDERTVAI